MKVAIALTSAVVLASAGSAFAWDHDFESAGGYTTSTPEFTDGIGDFWLRTSDAGSGSDYGTFMDYSSGSDGFYFAGMDLDGEGATLPITITFDAFSITGLTNLVFAADIAEDDDAANQDWDLLNDAVSFEYNIDGAGWMNIYTAMGDGVTQFNSEPRINGVFITSTWANFSQSLGAATGNSMQIRVVWFLDAGDEDLAIDNLSVTGIPTPGAFALLGVAGIAGLRRRR